MTASRDLSARCPRGPIAALPFLFLVGMACARSEPFEGGDAGAGGGAAGSTRGGAPGGGATGGGTTGGGTTGGGATGGAGTGGTLGGSGGDAGAPGGAGGSSTDGGAGNSGAGVAGRGGGGGVGGDGAAGRGGTGGSAGSAAGRGGGGSGRGGGAAGASGSGGGGAGGGAGGTAGLGGVSLCTPGRFLFCEDFESTAVGAIPAGWTKSGDATVQADQAARGSHALKIGAAANGARRISADATRLGSGHWGRIFYRVQLPVPTAFVHSTMVAFQGVGPSGGSGEFRVVDTVKNADSGGTAGSHQFLYNIQYSSNEVGRGSAYNYHFDGNWHCAEWHIDNPTQAYQFYLDGTQVSLSGNAAFDVPPVFSQVRVGWNNYQSAPAGFVAWIDEVAMDVARIGCGN